MEKLALLCIGDLKFKELKELEKKYLKKIGYFSKLVPTVLKDVDIRDEKAKKAGEGAMILDAIKKRDFVILLDERGKTVDSVAFSRLLEDKLSYHPGRTVFVIGGHAGVAQAVRDRADVTLSFSALTFAHDLFRIVFLEQLYRAFTIIKGIKYHR